MKADLGNPCLAVEVDIDFQRAGQKLVVVVCCSAAAVSLRLEYPRRFPLPECEMKPK